VYINTKRAPVMPKLAEPILIKGCIIDKDTQLRKPYTIGCKSSGMTLPEGWLKSMTYKEHIKAQLILAENEEMYILLCKPKPEDMEIKA